MTEPTHTTIEYLTGKFASGAPILMTGAGFSLDAKDVEGRAIPAAPQLTQELWPFCEINEAYDPGSRLQEVYQVALRKQATQLGAYLRSRFRIDPQSLPAYYADYYNLRWSKAYTLNIDDLEVAASVKFSLQRKPIPVSGVTAPRYEAEPADGSTGELKVVHLHGTLSDIPDKVTFSTAQYAARAKGADPHYATLAAELLVRPFVFVGTSIDETPLWQHVEMRRERGRGTSELRPKSYLVSPTLSAARRAMLREYNVVWLEMTARQFAEQILHALPDPARQSTAGKAADSSGTLPLVAALSARTASVPTEYLLGQEPQWTDILSGRAITREIDEVLASRARGWLKGGSAHVLVLAGTAGSGKSTSLLRLSLALSNDGLAVGYCDREDDISPNLLARACDKQRLNVLAIDDAARYGEALPKLLTQGAFSRPGLLSIISMRSSAVERFLPTNSVKNSSVDIIALPGLTDSDIDGLLETLARNNRLGVLLNKPRNEQVRAFRDQAGRQLLVAMIQATSGKKFEEKLIDELDELTQTEQHLYALAAVATGRDFSLSTSELLLAFGESDNTVLNLIVGLEKRRLLVHPKETQTNLYRVRHREVARVLTEHFAERGDMRNLIEGLAFAAANSASPSEPRNSRNWRFLKAFISHKYLAQALDIVDARTVYGRLEDVLSKDHHFWLQRGALEVKLGDLNLARHFLNNARSLNTNDHLLVTEYAYLEMRVALANPRAPGASKSFADAVGVLEEQIMERGDRDSYPYHLLGSQLLTWARLQVGDREELRDLIRRVIGHVRAGKKAHPGSKDLEGLEEALNKELLNTYV